MVTFAASESHMRGESKTDSSQNRPSADKAEAEVEDWDDVASQLSNHWREFNAHGAQLISARFGLLHIGAVRLAVRVAFLALLALVAATMTVVAVVYGVRGLAEVLERLFGGRRWAGDLSIAVLLLGIVFLTARIAGRRLLAAQQQSIRKSYEIRHQTERAAAADEESADAGRS